MAKNTSEGYQDEPWDELIDGKTVFMTPNPGFNHFCVAGNIGFLFANYLGKNSAHTPFIGNFDVYLTETGRFNPDMV